MTRALWRLAVCVPLALDAQSRSAGAAGEVPAAARAVINSVMSPYCPGLLLPNCPSPAADSLRRAIVTRAAQGETEAQLRRALVATYGEAVLAAPAMRGAGILAWTVPFLLIAGAGTALWFWLRMQRTTGTAPAASDASVSVAEPGDAERLRRLEALVRRS